jgi:hypothetical protein
VAGCRFTRPLSGEIPLDFFLRYTSSRVTVTCRTRPPGHDEDGILELGLVAYVGVMPHLRKIPKDVELPSGSWPYAFGHSLYLDIELRGA